MNLAIKITPEQHDILLGKLKKFYEPESDPIAFIENAHDFIDTYNKYHIGPLDLDCNNGCSYCCHVPVEVTALEANYIQHHTGIEPSANRFRKKPYKGNDPCPFLRGGQCSIYQARPIACRTFFSVDGVEPCKSNEAHHTFTVMSNDTIASVMGTIFEASQHTPYATYQDIRHYFNPRKIGNIL